jgi:hypothetical protein
MKRHSIAADFLPLGFSPIIPGVGLTVDESWSGRGGGLHALDATLWNYGSSGNS